MDKLDAVEEKEKQQKEIEAAVAAGPSAEVPILDKLLKLALNNKL